MYNFAFLCTGTSNFESALGEENLSAIIILVSVLLSSAILAVPFLLSKKYWHRVDISKRILLVISWIVGIPVAIAAGLSAWFFLAIATC